MEHTDWKAFAITLLTLVMSLLAWGLRMLWSDVQTMKEKHARLDERQELSSSGVEKRLDTIHHDIQSLRALMSDALQELAEERGARRRS